MAKPKVLIVTDSAFLDTGFGRVAREIGTGLVATGQFEVTQFGWFHKDTDKLIPFRVIPTESSTQEFAMADQYGRLTYDRVIAKVQPDVVITIGDEWAVRHIAGKPRKHKLIGYFPIDSAPVATSWCKTFRLFDKVVAYGVFGKDNILLADPTLSVDSIAHGVDTDVFRPLEGQEKAEARNMISPSAKFIIGSFARNNARKGLPRLIKTFRQFLNPSTSCWGCGNVDFTHQNRCRSCGATGDSLVYTVAKDDALLYLHCCKTDPAGHDLLELVGRYKLNGSVGFPEGMEVGVGVSDTVLNRLYNACDMFTLPTTGEGWGLPIAEAMSAGLPVLVTDYSAHTEYVSGCGELIRVSEFETDPSCMGERAIVDIFDYVAKMDRFYYEPKDFVRKWGPFLKISNGMSDEQIAGIVSGKRLRDHMGSLATSRMQHYNWTPITLRWVQVINETIGFNPGGVELPEMTLEEV